MAWAETLKLYNYKSVNPAPKPRRLKLNDFSLHSRTHFLNTVNPQSGSRFIKRAWDGGKVTLHLFER